MNRFVLIAALMAALPAAARACDAPVCADDYTLLWEELDGIITFDTLPSRAEPGLNFDQNVYFAGAWLGERLVGQTLETDADNHDRLTGQPDAPLTLLPGAPKRNLTIAFHRGFGSNALFPLGPKGFEDIRGRGEGAVTVVFDQDQAALGLRVHAHYPMPLGATPPEGRLRIAFFARDGREIAALDQQLGAGVADLGWRRADYRPDIAAITITNDDPGGVALDDIIFQLTPPLG